MKIIGYIVIEIDELEGLMREVAKKIAEGWKPQGGVCTTSYEYEEHQEKKIAYYYCQALIR